MCICKEIPGDRGAQCRWGPKGPHIGTEDLGIWTLTSTLPLLIVESEPAWTFSDLVAKVIMGIFWHSQVVLARGPYIPMAIMNAWLISSGFKNHTHSRLGLALLGLICCSLNNEVTVNTFTDFPQLRVGLEHRRLAFFGEMAQAHGSLLSRKSVMDTPLQC